MRETVRTSLVTGGSSGIGAATARALARHGHRVWITYRRGRDAAAAVVADLETCSRGLGHAAFPLDHLRPHGIRSLLAALPGPVDVLVANAAVGTASVRTQANEAGRDEVFFRVNCLGPLGLVRELVPGMVNRGWGKVVLVSSVGGGVAAFPGFDYADGMSKAAIAYLTRHLAAELAHDPVDVFCACPGATDTPMLRASTLDHLDDSGRRGLIRRLPDGRLVHPDEIGELIAWLCGDSARVLRGAVLDASLGLGVHPGLLTATDPAARR